MEINGKRIFMKPGKTNKEDRENFVIYWVECMKSLGDMEWSKKQNRFINLHMEMFRSFNRSFKKRDGILRRRS